MVFRFPCKPYLFNHQILLKVFYYKKKMRSQLRTYQRRVFFFNETLNVMLDLKAARKRRRLRNLGSVEGRIKRRNLRDPVQLPVNPGRK